MTSRNAVEISAGEVPTRDQIALEDTWDLSEIYPTERATVVRDGIMTLRQTLERIRVYAALRRDENLANSEALARYERSVAIAIEAGEALSFVEPELLTLPPERFAELRADPLLTP